MRAPPMGTLYKVALMVAWLSNSMVMVLLNKYVMLRLPYPIGLALWHMVCATATFWGISRWSRHGAPPPVMDVAMQVQLCAVGVLFAATLILGLAAYIWLPVSSIQMLKLSGPVTSFALSMALRLDTYSHLHAAKVAVVCVGVGVASWGDLSFSALGVAAQLGATACEALRQCMAQIVLSHGKSRLTPMEVLTVVTPATALVLWVPFSLVELPRLERSLPEALAPMVPAVLASGALACSLNLLQFSFIRATSALTTNVSGILKDVGLIALSVVLYSVPLTALQLSGYAIALSGVLWFQWGKLRGQQPAPPPPAKGDAAPGGGGGGGGQGEVAAQAGDSAVEQQPLLSAPQGKAAH